MLSQFSNPFVFTIFLPRAGKKVRYGWKRELMEEHVFVNRKIKVPLG
jgi:hypothetical protein